MISFPKVTPSNFQLRKIAVAGNPNTGKTTLFNAITGSNAKIGNYPGITVDRRTGIAKLPLSGKVELIDVPGTYSLTARSRDEEVAINELLGRKGLAAPDLALIVLDATALERSLFLVMQVLEFGIPTVAAVNMLDSANEEGIEIDFERLEQIFGIPFVGVSARKGKGIRKLVKVLDEELTRPEPRKVGWLWEPNQQLSEDLDLFDKPIAEEVKFKLESEQSRRAFALWMLMSLEKGSDLVVRPRLAELVHAVRGEMHDAGRDIDDEVIVSRYDFIDKQAPDFIRRPEDNKASLTDRIDSVLTHPLWGLLVFLIIMGLIFQALFSWSDPLIGWIEGLFESLTGMVEATMPEGTLRDLISSGIISGVGGVVVFLPQILFLFFFLSVLEGTGYLARAAFMIDRWMRMIGLHGQAFVPMLSGFACAVPAIMATRTIENRRDRMLTLMVVPLISCSARLPVYTLIIALLFPATEKLGFVSIGTLMLLAIYGLSTILTLVAAAVLGRTAFKGRPMPFLLELPPYRMPNLRTVMMMLWERSKIFLTTAGTIILVMTIILWALLSFPKDVELSRDYDALRTAAQGNESELANLDNQEQSERLQASYAGRLGHLIEPAIAPLGFDWKIGIGLIGAFAAREVFVGTMGVVYGIGESGEEDSSGLRDTMRKDKRADGSPLWTPLVGMSLMVFFMLAMQCLSTLAVTRRETKSWGWTMFMLGYMTTAAYLASLFVYQTGRLFGLE